MTGLSIWRSVIGITGKKYIAKARKAVIKYAREILGHHNIIEIKNRSNLDKTI